MTNTQLQDKMAEALQRLIDSPYSMDNLKNAANILSEYEAQKKSLT